ncbi:MAG: hypothetical protein HRT44_09705 [Bdellovibrionales bacterium]|nr:hypothetical protein [Bdellovibrionales bacterium]
MEWYNLRSCDYYDDFEDAKIIYPDISQDISFAWDDEGHYLNDSCHMMCGAGTEMFAFLNSTICKWQIKSIAYSLGQSATRLKKIFINEVVAPSDLSFLKDISLKLIKSIKSGDQKKVEDYKKQIDILVFDYFNLNEDEVEAILGHELLEVDGIAA